ncbi:MAG: PH domain-containing protein [Planctomycetaceae bacterium]
MNQHPQQNLTFQCPKCQRQVGIPAEMLGRQVECPLCQQVFVSEAPLVRAVGSNTAPPARTAQAQPFRQVIHPVVYRSHLLGTAICLLLIVGGLLAMIGLVPAAMKDWPLLLIGGISVLIGAATLLKGYIESRMTSLTLLDERIIYARGLITRNTSELLYADIRNMQIDRNLVERLLNFGDMALSSSGQDEMEIVIKDIPDPESVAEFIRDRQRLLRD